MPMAAVQLHTTADSQRLIWYVERAPAAALSAGRRELLGTLYALCCTLRAVVARVLAKSATAVW